MTALMKTRNMNTLKVITKTVRGGLVKKEKQLKKMKKGMIIAIGESARQMMKEVNRVPNNKLQELVWVT